MKYSGYLVTISRSFTDLILIVCLVWRFWILRTISWEISPLAHLTHWKTWTRYCWATIILNQFLRWLHWNLCVRLIWEATWSVSSFFISTCFYFFFHFHLFSSFTFPSTFNFSFALSIFFWFLLFLLFQFSFYLLC